MFTIRGPGGYYPALEIRQLTASSLRFVLLHRGLLQQRVAKRT